FLGGLTGQLFRELALANVLAQVASLLVSVTLVPALASWWLRVPGRSGPRPGPAATGVPAWLERFLARPGLTLAGGLCLVLAVLPAGRQLGTEFLPDVNGGAVDVSLILPAGATLEQTGVALGRVESVVAGMRGVSYFVSRAGQG